MRYQVMIVRKASKELKSLPVRSRESITERIAMLGRNPDDPALDVKRLNRHPKADFRLRAGAYRVLFNREDTIHIVEIVRVAHRKEVYQ
jgi:mRNA interferase RelE/StbE